MEKPAPGGPGACVLMRARGESHASSERPQIWRPQFQAQLWGTGVRVGVTGTCRRLGSSGGRACGGHGWPGREEGVCGGLGNRVEPRQAGSPWPRSPRSRVSSLSEGQRVGQSSGANSSWRRCELEQGGLLSDVIPDRLTGRAVFRGIPNRGGPRTPPRAGPAGTPGTPTSREKAGGMPDHTSCPPGASDLRLLWPHFSSFKTQPSPSPPPPAVFLS